LARGRVTLFARGRDRPAVQLVHERDGHRAVLATEIETADSLFAQMRGLMFRRSVPEDYALVFRFDEAGPRDVHMLFVPFPLDVLWVVDEEVVAKRELSPWTGLGKDAADMLVELPGGAAEQVAVGDRVRLTEDVS
jgi:hypothetical protein